MFKENELNLSEGELIELTTQRIHHLADVIEAHFGDHKPTPDEVNALDGDIIDITVDEQRIDEAWELYTHRPSVKGGGSFDYTAREKLTGDALKEAVWMYFHEQKIPEKDKPKVSDLKKQFRNVTAAMRDEVWSQYTLEIQLKTDKTIEE